MDRCSMAMRVVSPWVPRVAAFWAPPLMEMSSHRHHVACFTVKNMDRALASKPWMQGGPQDP